ncbi:MAG: iron ABC transporter permease [Bacilli bacterium]|nr:iron ABC transporter permease [Bacilli bacterium]
MEQKLLAEGPQGEMPESNNTKKRFNFKKYWNLFTHYISKPSNIIVIFFAIFLTLMVIYPLIQLVLSSLKVNGPFEAGLINDEWNLHVKNGQFTFMQWPSLLFPQSKELKSYSQNNFWLPLGRSILMSLSACAFAVISGGVVAYLVTRTNLPCKKLISTVFIFPYIMPSWSIAMFWENFFKNSAVPSAPGIGLLESLTGICVPNWMIYGFLPCAIVMGIHYAPFAYILIGGILRNMDANLEEAAVILKANRWKITYRITLPIVGPAMISTILLVFSSSLSTYTVPEKLKFPSISFYLRGAFSTVGFHGFGYVMAVVLLVFSVLILTLNNWFTKSRRNFTTVSGKSGQASKVNLRGAKWPITIVVLILVFFSSIVPLITFVLESLEETSGVLSSISLKYWISAQQFDSFIASKNFSTQGVFHNRTIWESFGRSLITSVSVALLAGTAGILIGYAVSKDRRGKLTNFVSSVAFLPYLIPALSFSAVFYALIKMPALSFLDQSTTQLEVSALAICIIVGSVKFLPMASRTGTNAMLQVSGEIEEAAIITGCPWWKRMVKILFPIQKSSFISGYLLPFISCMREYTLFILVTSQVTLITNTLQYFSINGIGQLSNAINLLIVVFVLVANFLVNILTGASIDKGIGG